jgi:hypothetical protein
VRGTGRRESLGVLEALGLREKHEVFLLPARGEKVARSDG